MSQQDTHLSGKHRLVGGRYLLDVRLGAGGMGTVWKAQQIGVGNTVAIKFLNPLLSENPGIIKRFEQEAKVSLEVTHPGAAQLLDTGRDPKTGELYIVFEFVEGEDLRARLTRDGSLPFDEAREIAMRVGEVLAAAHARGIVHRDIKPENIRLRRDLGGTYVKVLDFGIAKFRPEADARLTAEGANAGTPGYMAPEQVRAEPIDGRADIYALGLVTFEMMAGVPTFTSTAAPALLVDQLTTPMPKLRERVPGRDYAALDEVLAKACAKDPAQRFRSAGEFVAAMKALAPAPWSSRARPAVAPALRATPIEVTPLPPEATVPPLPPSSSSTLPYVLAALTGLALLGGTVSFGVWKLRAGSSTPVGALAPDCPGMDIYKAELRSMPVAELEQRLLTSRLWPPSTAPKQLELLKATSASFDPAKRDCMYRMMLMGSVATEETTLTTTPELWGQTRSLDELEMLWLEMPLKERWTVAQRKDVFAQIDELFVSSVTKGHPEDATHWKRQYYGTVLTCEVTDEALEQLKAKRPTGCFGLKPRN